jgi:hypothetical protein
MKLTDNIQLSTDPQQLVVQLTSLLRDITQQVNGLTSGAVYSVHSARIAAPTTGTFAQGDFTRNATPSGATPVFGWICTASGTPGTWVALTAN